MTPATGRRTLRSLAQKVEALDIPHLLRTQGTSYGGEFSLRGRRYTAEFSVATIINPETKIGSAFVIYSMDYPNPTRAVRDYRWNGFTFYDNVFCLETGLAYHAYRETAFRFEHRSRDVPQYLDLLTSDGSSAMRLVTRWGSAIIDGSLRKEGSAFQFQQLSITVFPPFRAVHDTVEIHGRDRGQKVYRHAVGSYDDAETSVGAIRAVDRRFIDFCFGRMNEVRSTVEGAGQAGSAGRLAGRTDSLAERGKTGFNRAGGEIPGPERKTG